MSNANEDTLGTVYDAFTKGDVATVMSLLTDDIKFHVSGRSPVCGDYSGKDEVLGFFGKLMERSGGTFQLEVLDILANDEHGVTLTMERGQREGKTLENRAAHVWDMKDGRCSRFRGYNEEAWDEFWS
jgi:ketosteroid isomerase-like protein